MEVWIAGILKSSKTFKKGRCSNEGKREQKEDTVMKAKGSKGNKSTHSVLRTQDTLKKHRVKM